jgi:hypothetical protein
MSTAQDIQRLTIAPFETAPPLGSALEAVGGAGFGLEALSVTGEAETLRRAADALKRKRPAGWPYAALFEAPVPIVPLGDGAIACATRDGVLTRYKAGAGDPGQLTGFGRCPLSASAQAEMMERMRAGAVFLIVDAVSERQYILCQSMLLRHSAARVFGVQFVWRPGA